MEGIMFVCMDVGVAAAYVCFVMEGIMFLCMDVGDAAGGHPRISQGEGVLSKRLKHTKYELPPLGRALKKSPFFMTKTENAYDL